MFLAKVTQFWECIRWHGDAGAYRREDNLVDSMRGKARNPENSRHFNVMYFRIQAFPNCESLVTRNCCSFVDNVWNNTIDIDRHSYYKFLWLNSSAFNNKQKQQCHWPNQIKWNGASSYISHCFVIFHQTAPHLLFEGQNENILPDGSVHGNRSAKGSRDT